MKKAMGHFGDVGWGLGVLVTPLKAWALRHFEDNTSCDAGGRNGILWISEA